jgi:hypothetical protein
MPPPLVGALGEAIGAMRQVLAQEPCSPAELDAAIGKAVQNAGSIAALEHLLNTGRLREVVEQRPFNLEMDIVNKCNLRCVMCMMSHPSLLQQPLRRFPIERFERLADEVFWHLNALSFTYGTEPLLHPQFTQFVEIASRYRVPRV